MKRRVGFLLLPPILALIPLILILSHSLSAQSPSERPTTTNWDKLDAALQIDLATQPDDHQFRVIIDLEDKADLTGLARESSLQARRFGTVERLKETAVASQANLLRKIESLSIQEAINHYHPFWIVNKIAVQGSKEAIQALSTHPDVVSIRPDAPIASIAPPSDDEILTLLETPFAVSATNIPTETGHTWGVDRIRAPYVWHGLGIDGNGVTIAIMDSGVDYTHPALIDSYRGNLGGGVFEHAGNFLHTSIPTTTVPTDTNGHGTHVAGTAVGKFGIGVAPGAKWIAVSMSDENGVIFESEGHKGFEWVLAPNGDPSLAPDIANNSWGYNVGFITAFYADVLALHAAGIIPVFAAGNTGPFAGTVGAPASYTDTLAIGASHEFEEVAWFSSLGPSPITDEPKPWVLAPGTEVYSALPNNQYRYANGTSMATPHAAGTLALILSANNSLTRHELVDTLANTSVPISSTQPNMAHGWGRIDAYAAVSSQVNHGKLTGIVHDNGIPIPDVRLTITTPSDNDLIFITDENGRYSANLISGSYNISLQQYGFFDFLANGISVLNGQTNIFDINLNRVPSGTVHGVVRSAETNQPLPETEIYINGWLASTTTDENGRFNLILPTGSHKLTAKTAEHKIEQYNILVETNSEIIQNFNLVPTRAILIVDSGRWYFQSQASYYEKALNSLGYPVDTWSLGHPFISQPSLADLATYDDIIWSAPIDSPGYIYAGSLISDALGLGKNVLISGQNVGYYDGAGFDIQHWWFNLLDATYLGSNYITQTIVGAPNSSYENIQLTLNGGDSAQNQIYPEVSQSRTGYFSEPNFYFEDGHAAGLQAGHCKNYRLGYLGFGLEGVTDAVDRAAILEQSFDYFDSPSIQFGVQMSPNDVDDFAFPGQKLIYTITLHNRSETLTDTFHIKSSGLDWQTSILTENITLGPCSFGETVLKIIVDENAPKNFEHMTQVTAVSSNNPAIKEHLILNHKTPGDILFVDDDRFYDNEGKLTATLDEMGIDYDVWETGYNQKGRGSPTDEILNEYEFVIWYTGYDWFAPILPSEREDLTNYLAQGGRLFLSSQDFLYDHIDSELAQSYFGVRDFWEYWGGVPPTAVFASDHSAIDESLAGPNFLDFSIYQNHTDAIIPHDLETVSFWYDRGYPAGTLTHGAHWRAAFVGYPLELISPTERSLSMNRIVGWLSDYGESTFTVDKQTAPNNETRTYTITVRNAQSGVANSAVSMTNTIPISLTINPASIVGDAIYNPSTRELTWHGVLGIGDAHHIVYEATPDNGLPVGTAVTNTLSIHYDRHGLQFDKNVIIWMDAPDLRFSAVTATPNQPYAGDMISYTYQLSNTGLAPTNGVSATLPFPDFYFPLTDTLTSTAGTAVLGDHRVFWEGDLAPTETVTVMLAMTRTVALQPQWIPTTGILKDGLTRPVVAGNLWVIQPYTRYFPLISQNK